jgi:hypothetical protein
MTFRPCLWEKELAHALKAGHWPDGCTPELRVHVAGCTGCRDLVLVGEAFQQAKKQSARETPSGSPGLLWWRAQLRRRNAAAQKITRPITIAQTFAFMLTLLVAAIFAAWQYDHGLRWGAWGSDETVTRALHLVSAGFGLVQGNVLLLVAPLGVLALFGGLVLYLVSAKS